MKVTSLIACAVPLLLVLPASAPAQKGNSGLQAPKNLRITGITSYTISLKWDKANNKSDFNYVVQASNGRTVTVPGTQDGVTWAPGVEHHWSYTFFVYAFDGTKKSQNSNSVTTTFPRDVLPPTQPVVQHDTLSPTHIGTTFSSTDDGHVLRYDVFVNGTQWFGGLAQNSLKIYLLQPQTTYTIQVRARDGGNNLSPLSDPLVVVTPSPDPNDVIAPSAPSNPWEEVFDGATELWLRWSDSVDNVTPPDLIRYDVYLNGVYEGSAINFNRVIMYLTPGVLNTIEIFATDEAGNRSAPTTVFYDLRSP